MMQKRPGKGERTFLIVDEARKKADLIAAAALERKAFDPALFDVSRLTSIADYFFVCSCRSSRQVQAVAEHISARYKEATGKPPLGVEGKKEALWVLIDFGEVVAHIFHRPYREFYDLDGLWTEAPRIPLAGAEEEEDHETGETPWEART
jgi:ribosome-associated protein